MSVWWGRRPAGDADPATARVELLGFDTDDHDDGVIVDLDPDDLPTSEPIMRSLAEARSGRIVELHVAAAVHPTAPPLWYVEQPQPAARPPAMVLVGYATDHLPEGAVVDTTVFERMPVHSGEQVGAVRWYSENGLVHQVYVAPAHRRRGIGTKLLAAAGAYRAARGWAPIWNDGDRTDVGDLHTSSLISAFQDRVRPRYQRP